MGALLHLFPLSLPGQSSGLCPSYTLGCVGILPHVHCQAQGDCGQFVPGVSGERGGGGGGGGSAEGNRGLVFVSTKKNCILQAATHES